jgi:hypothetical protein
MSGELVRDAPDLTGLHWADGGTPETATEPDESLKDDGYAPNAKPASVAWNWRDREIGRLAAWLAGSTVRRFDRLDLALVAADPAVPVGAEFSVSPAVIATWHGRPARWELSAHLR